MVIFIPIISTAYSKHEHIEAEIKWPTFPDNTFKSAFLDENIHFADDAFKCVFLDENIWISINISLKWKGPINNIPN